MVVLELVFLVEYTFLDHGFGVGYKVVLLEQYVMDQEAECPHIDFRAIRLFSEDFGGHEDRCADDFFVYLFLNCKAEVSQFVEHVGTLLFQENVVGLDVPVDDIVFRDELYSTSKLIDDFKSFRLGKSTLFVDDLVQVAIRAKLENHGNVVFGQETIIDLGREHSVRVLAESELPQDVDLTVYLLAKMY